MINNENGNDYVSLVRIQRKWFHVFVWFFSTAIVVNTLAELLTDWAWKGLGETTWDRTAVLMTLIVGWFFIISHIWEGIMLGYAKMFKDRVFAEGVAVGIAEGITEGKAEGIVEGEAAYRRKVVAWNRRREQAEKEGREFTEPLPPIEERAEPENA